MTREGSCLCGAVRYAVEAEPSETVHCHCRMCQRASGSGFVTWATFERDAVRYTAGTPAIYRSSAGAVREFCGRCGTPLVFRADDHPTVDITLASLDDPEAFRPVANTWVTSRQAWMHGFDHDLPDHPEEWPN
jgi:hypothetical protein